MADSLLVDTWGLASPTMDCWCDPRPLDNQDTLVSGRTFQEFRDYLPGAKIKSDPPLSKVNYLLYNYRKILEKKEYYKI